ncbi:MAG: hypothetical protein AAFQ40_16545, partial [Cyanobacteria bacterium J06623_5]
QKHKMCLSKEISEKKADKKKQAKATHPRAFDPVNSTPSVGRTIAMVVFRIVEPITCSKKQAGHRK